MQRAFHWSVKFGIKITEFDRYKSIESDIKTSNTKGGKEVDVKLGGEGY